MRDLIIGYWPAWFLGAALFVGWRVNRWDERVARARVSLSELDAQRACRPSPAPIDVEPMG